MKLISQFLNEDFKFIKLKSTPITDLKHPLNKKWNKGKSYRFNEEDFTAYLNNGAKGYGVCGGYGNLVIADCDSKEVASAIQMQLPDTLVSKTGGGKWHFYR